VKRLLKYLAYTALSATLLLALGAYAAYRSLLPADLPAKSTTTFPPIVRGSVQLVLGGDANAALARLHFDRLGNRGRLPSEGYQKSRLRERALGTWLSLHWSADEVADAYAAQVSVGGDRFGLGSGAQALFAKSLPQLAPHEVALLMVLAYSPGELDPACHPERARAARDAFLTHMAAAHLVAADAVPALQAMPVHILEPCPPSAAEGGG
jgi:hypothetical protein